MDATEIQLHSLSLMNTYATIQPEQKNSCVWYIEQYLPAERSKLFVVAS